MRQIKLNPLAEYGERHKFPSTSATSWPNQKQTFKILNLHNNNYFNVDHMKVADTNVTVEMKKADNKKICNEGEQHDYRGLSISQLLRILTLNKKSELCLKDNFSTVKE